MKKPKQPKLIEFKGSTVPVIVITLRSLEVETLNNTALELFGDSDFFDGDAGLLELSQMEAAETADWGALQDCFARHGLKLIGVRGGNPALQASALAAGLPVFPADERNNRAPEPQAAPEPVTPEAPTSEAPACQAMPADQAELPLERPAPPAEAAPLVQEAPAPAPSRSTMVVDRPLRSGQQVYARGSDLVVLAIVNPGAEVIADGSIHIYAPLRGRALAGATGDSKARIFTTRFEAELVSVAGVYRTFEGGVPADLAAKPVQVKLDGDGNKLLLDPLQLN